MSQVDQVTQRNASSAEELAAAAETLSAHASSLHQIAGYFRIDETPVAPAPRPRVATPAPAPIVIHRGSNGVRKTARAGGDRDFQPF
jgi:methyl-accepting chemotaxis protein